MRQLICYLVSCLLALTNCSVSFALESVYEDPNDFISRHFEGDPPKPSTLYPDSALKKSIKDILGNSYSKFRIRYWLHDGKSVWILEEIGKEKFITSGFVVKEGIIKGVKVLIFRESRGWEVRYDSFTDQFIGAKLSQSLKLDRNIDGISGATLSVRAVTKLARLALLFHRTVMSDKG